MMVWLIILVILSYSNVAKKWVGNNVLDMAIFDSLESILLQVGVTWKGLQTLVRPS